MGGGGIENNIVDIDELLFPAGTWLMSNERNSDMTHLKIYSGEWRSDWSEYNGYPNREDGYVWPFNWSEQRWNLDHWDSDFPTKILPDYITETGRDLMWKLRQLGLCIRIDMQYNRNPIQYSHGNRKISWWYFPKNVYVELNNGVVIKYKNK